MMSEPAAVIRWETPPATKAKGGRSYARSQYEHLAAQLRTRSGEWALVREAGNPNSAASVAGVIRDGRVMCFIPRGDFEACVRVVDGRYRVYARHLGDEDET